MKRWVNGKRGGRNKWMEKKWKGKRGWKVRKGGIDKDCRWMDGWVEMCGVEKEWMC